MVATHGEAEVYPGGSYEILLDDGLGKVTGRTRRGVWSERIHVRYQVESYRIWSLWQTAFLPTYIPHIIMLL